MHFLSFLFALASVSITNAATTYVCTDQRSPKFDSDCLAAATYLVHSQTGLDDYGYYPNRPIEAQIGDCLVRVNARGNRVALSSILVSYFQLIARCQDGYFYYGDKYLFAEVISRAGLTAFKALPSTSSNSSGTPLTTGLSHAEDRDGIMSQPNDLTNKSASKRSLRKRLNYISEVASPSGRYMQIYRGFTVTLPIILLNSAPLHELARTRVMDLALQLANSNNRWGMVASAVSTSGSRSVVRAISMFPGPAIREWAHCTATSTPTEGLWQLV